MKRRLKQLTATESTETWFFVCIQYTNAFLSPHSWFSMGVIKVPTDTISWEGEESDEKLGIWAAFPGRRRDANILVYFIDKCAERKIVWFYRKWEPVL